MQQQCCHYLNYEEWIEMTPPFSQENYPDDWTMAGAPCTEVTSECCPYGQPGGGSPGGGIPPIGPADPEGKPKKLQKPIPKKRLTPLRESVKSRLQKLAGIKKQNQ